MLHALIPVTVFFAHHHHHLHHLTATLFCTIRGCVLTR